MFAIFEDVGMGEILLMGIAGVLLFGKRLPEVAGQAGAQLVKLRRSLQQVKNETGMDQEMRKIQRTLEEAIPRDLSVGEVARLASARVEERLRNARKEVDLGLDQPLDRPLDRPPDEPAPPALPPAPPPAKPDAPGTGEAPAQPG